MTDAKGGNSTGGEAEKIFSPVPKAVKCDKNINQNWGSVCAAKCLTKGIPHFLYSKVIIRIVVRLEVFVSCQLCFFLVIGDPKLSSYLFCAVG